MGGFVKGDVVVIPSPFSNLTTSKRRSALVLTNLPSDDVILCQITSQPAGNAYSVTLVAQDFATGGLHRSSTIRPERLFTS